MHDKIHEMLEADKTPGLRKPLKELEESYHDFYDHNLQKREGVLPSARKIARIIEEYCGDNLEQDRDIQKQKHAPVLLSNFNTGRRVSQVEPAVEDAAVVDNVLFYELDFLSTCDIIIAGTPSDKEKLVCHTFQKMISRIYLLLYMNTS
jgi:hypothetical protein